jgi:hypothetical protein
MRRRLAFAVAAALAVLTPRAASAQQDEGASRPSSVTWHEDWPKFRWWEYGVTAASWGTTIASGYVLPDTPYGWRGINDFDESIRDGLRWSSSSARLVRPLPAT